MGSPSTYGRRSFPSSSFRFIPCPRISNPLSPPFVISAAAVVLLTAAVWSLRRRAPSLLAAWLFYGITLFPVLGVAHFGLKSSRIATPTFRVFPGPFWRVLFFHGVKVLPRLSVAVIIAACLSVLTWRQCRVWKSSETLWGFMAAQDPGHAIARDYLGNLALEQGRTDEAILYYQEALKIDPDYGAAHNNLGTVSRGRAGSMRRWRNTGRSCAFIPITRPCTLI